MLTRVSLTFVLKFQLSASQRFDQKFIKQGTFSP